jgi:hypothetical protein
LLGPRVAEVPNESSKRTGSIVLEARFPSVLDRNHNAEEMATARQGLRQRVLEN